jgi:predicted nucleic-acid-binding protein
MPPLAVDTNVLARALVDDSSAQTASARRLMRDGPVFVPESVLLETEWVLRSRFMLDGPTIVQLLLSLAATANVHFEDRARVMHTILAYERGLDFADAMHLYAARDCEALVTFDKEFGRRSRQLDDTVPVRTI